MTALNKDYKRINGATDTVADITARHNLSMTEIEADMTTIESDFGDKVDKNTAITGATKTKVTYDAKGLVTGGADATTADIADSTDKRYCTDAQKTVIGNTSNTNTGDQTDATLTFTDITTNDSSSAKHGFLKKLSNNAAQFLNGVGEWVVPSGSGDVAGPATNTDNFIPQWDGANSKTLKNGYNPAMIPLNLPNGYLINGKIVPSVASNNLTVALKGMDGNDPSATNPVYIRLNGVIRSVTSALSVTKNAGTNWCNSGSTALATKEIDYFVYIGYNATDGVVIGFSRYPAVSQYSEFSLTTTNEKYCAISTTTTAASTDYYSVVGRFAATLSAGAGYTWSVPTFTAINLVQRPIYQTRLLSFAPVYTGFSVDPSTISNYKIDYSSCWVNSAISGFGTSNATGYTVSIPFASALGVAIPVGRIVDNSAQVAAGWGAMSSSTITFYKSAADTNTWTASGSKGVGYTILYTI